MKIILYIYDYEEASEFLEEDSELRGFPDWGNRIHGFGSGLGHAVVWPRSCEACGLPSPEEGSTAGYGDVFVPTAKKTWRWWLGFARRTRARTTRVGARPPVRGGPPAASSA